MSEITRNPDKNLDAVFWKPPAAIIKESLINPFFTKEPLPNYITNKNLFIFFRATQELSQLIHTIAVNSPNKGYRVNYTLGHFLSFHVNHMLNISFRDEVFMKSLHVVDDNDYEASDFLEFLMEFRAALLSRWELAIGADPTRGGSDVKENWIAVKNIADAISTKAISIVNAEDRFVLKLPYFRLFDAYTTEGNIPSKVIIAWVGWGIVVAMFVNIMSWIMWKYPSLWNAVVTTIVCTTGFGGFLLLVYTVSRRRVVALWYAKELSTNLSKDHFRYVVEREESMRKIDQDLLFFMQAKESVIPRVLALDPLLINRQVVMIGITDINSLQICSWNLCAKKATDISWEQAIGKSLQAVMHPRSIPNVRHLFAETKSNPNQQKRLLFNSITKGLVAIKATATIAHVDGIPIGMIVGSVLEEEERSTISYLSKVAVSTLLKRLDDLRVNDDAVRRIVTENMWDFLKERTTQAIRSWRQSSIDEVVQPLNVTNANISVHVDSDSCSITDFHCDIINIQYMLMKIVKCVEKTTPKACLNVTLGNIFNQLQCEILKIVFSIDPPQTFSMTDEEWDTVYNVGYLYSASPNEIVTFIPISPEAVTGKPHPSIDNTLVPFLCTLVVFEPDPVYLVHFKGFCGGAHRCFTVDDVGKLTKVLDNLGNDVSAVILSASDSKYEEMVRECSSRNAFVVAAKPRPTSDDFFSTTFDGPPQEGTNVNYILHKPVTEESWNRFLDHLQRVKQQQKSIQAPVSHECKKIKTIATSNNSRVDLVRDVLTNGVMVRKTVYITNERPLTSFSTEVEIMNKLESHRGIVRYISSYSPSPREFCMFFQYCKLGNMEDYVRGMPSHRIEVSQIRIYASQLLHTLLYIHQTGVAHRDIKPANILLLDEEHLTIGDFGSATQDPKLAGKLFGGSLHYVAPERLIENLTDNWSQGEMEKLFAEDVWSLGLTLLYMLGAYPSRLQSLTEEKAFMQFYIETRDSTQTSSPFFSISADDDAGDGDCVALASDFVTQMLHLRPEERQTVSTLIQHPFVADVVQDRSEIYQTSIASQRPSVVFHNVRVDDFGSSFAFTADSESENGFSSFAD